MHDPWQYLYPAAAVAVIVGLWFARARMGRGPLAAVLVFAGVLVPALGFFDVYPFRYSFVADHFQYHASMALIALATAGVTLGWRSIANDASTGLLGPATATSVLAVLSVLTWQRTLVYDSQMTLFTDVVARDPDSWIGHNNLGTLYLQQDLAQAIVHLSAASQLNSTYTETHNALASALAEMGECGRAIDWLERALAVPERASPTQRALSYNNLAWILATCRDEQHRDPPRAVEMAEAAVRIAPDLGALQGTLGAALIGRGLLASGRSAGEIHRHGGRRRQRRSILPGHDQRTTRPSRRSRPLVSRGGHATARARTSKRRSTAHTVRSGKVARARAVSRCPPAR